MIINILIYVYDFLDMNLYWACCLFNDFYCEHMVVRDICYYTYGCDHGCILSLVAPIGYSTCSLAFL